MKIMTIMIDISLQTNFTNFVRSRYRNQICTLLLLFLYIQQVSPTLVSSSRNRTIVVTDGNGGGPVLNLLIDELIAGGDKVVTINESFHDAIDASIMISRYEGDILNKTLLHHIFNTEQPTHICHIGGRPTESTTNPFLHIKNNIQATVALLSVATERKSTKPKFVLVSSSSIYDNMDKLSDKKTGNRTWSRGLDESILIYAATRKSGELFGHTWNQIHKVPFVSLRLVDQNLGNRSDDNVKIIMSALDNPSSSFDVIDANWEEKEAASYRSLLPRKTLESNSRLVVQSRNETPTKERSDANDEPKLVTARNSSSFVSPHSGHKTILVTGAAGFIGSHVANHLLARGDTVIIVDEMNDYYNISLKIRNIQALLTEFNHTGRLKVYFGDIANETLMESIFEMERPEWICHLAARAGVRPSILQPDLYVHSNVWGTVQLLELVKRYPIQNFVFASSSSVYGGSQSTHFTEDEVVDFPISPYAASKRSSEILSWAYHKLYNIPMTGLRFFTVYGPNGRPDMAPFQFIDRISRGMTINQYGDGRSSRDYTYIDDIVNGVVRALDRPNDFEIINLGKGRGTSLLDFIKYIQLYTDRNATIRLEPDQPGDVPYTCADVSKAKNILGYVPKVPFKEGIKRTIQWYNTTYLGMQKGSDHSNFVLNQQTSLLVSSDPALSVDFFQNSFLRSISDMWYMQGFIILFMIVLHFVFKFGSILWKMNETNDHTSLSTNGTIQKKRTSSDVELIQDEIVNG